MPYIPQDARREVPNRIYNHEARSIGELTYVLTHIILEHLEDRGVTFATYAGVLGALEAVKLELYRRAIAPYEDKKAAENGDLDFPQP